MAVPVKNSTLKSCKSNWSTPRKPKDVILSFDFIVSGMNGTYPAMLRRRGRLSRNIFSPYFTPGNVLTTWQKVVFISKSGKHDHVNPRKINLSSFPSKSMERLVERHVDDNLLRSNILNESQYAYQRGEFYELSLHSMVVKINTMGYT